jgi:hypothetical protein
MSFGLHSFGLQEHVLPMPCRKLHQLRNQLRHMSQVSSEHLCLDCWLDRYTPQQVAAAAAVVVVVVVVVIGVVMMHKEQLHVSLSTLVVDVDAD